MHYCCKTNYNTNSWNGVVVKDHNNINISNKHIEWAWDTRYITQSVVRCIVWFLLDHWHFKFHRLYNLHVCTQFLVGVMLWWIWGDLYCPTLTKGSKSQITQIWESDVFRFDLAYSTSIPSWEQKHSSYWKIFKSRHHNIALMSMYMTDIFCLLF